MTGSRADLVWWDLPAGIEVPELRSDLARVGVEEWLAVPGLALKLWLSDEATRRWGAVMLWDDVATGRSRAELPPNRARDAIGRAADVRLGFRVEGVAAPGGRPRDRRSGDAP